MPGEVGPVRFRHSRMLWRFGAWLLWLAALVFGGAGRLTFGPGWLFLALSAAGAVAGLILFWHRPALLAERLRPGPGQPQWDRYFLLSYLPLSFFNILFAAVDAGRLGHASRVPLWGQGAAAFFFGAGFALTFWAMHSNPFFSSAVRLQTERGHRVVEAGPYRRLRHPGYAGAILALLATPLVLRSLSGVGVGLLASLLLAVRAALEDSFLRRSLPGYLEYSQRVRWRLLPGFW